MDNKKEESIFELAKTIAELGVKPAIVQKFIYDTKIETAKQILKDIEELDKKLGDDEYNYYSHSDFASQLEDIIKAKFLQEETK